MLLTLGTWNTLSPSSTAEREYTLHYPSRYHLDANMFRPLEERLLEIESEVTTALVNTGRPQNCMDTS
jgi:hypothetical protein